jgi:outer membrane protein assembly factor BamB
MRRFVSRGGRLPAQLVCAVLVSAVLAASARAEDWPQFRGTNSSGVAGSTYPLPVEFSQTKNVKWSATLGDGIGCPIIVAGRAYATALVGEEKFGVFCFDAATGNLHWNAP